MDEETLVAPANQFPFPSNGKRRQSIQIMKLGQEIFSFNSLQTGKRRQGEKSRLECHWQNRVSIPFKRESVSKEYPSRGRGL